MLRIDLRSPLMNEKFAIAPVYRKFCTVQAVQVTESGLISGVYAALGVRKDGERYVIDTYVMRERNGRRVAELEAAQPISVGDWIITNPKQQPDDCLNIYAQPDLKFKKRYDPTGEDGVYRAKGATRVVQNFTGWRKICNPSNLGVIVEVYFLKK